MSLQALSAPRRSYRRDARGRFLPAARQVMAPAPRRVLFVAPEMTDFVKTGGLGDVAAALPRALRERCDVRVLIPGYPAVLARGTQLRVVGRIGGRASIPPCTLGLMCLPDGLPVYVLLNPTLYARSGTPYSAGGGADWEDNAVRFAALSHAAAEIAAGRAGLAWQPEVLHLNDWPTALAAGFVRWDRTPVATVLTIHNLAYQGLFPLAQAAALGVPAYALGGATFHGRFSMLRAGLVDADQVSTVSHSYAREVTTEVHGCGLHALLAERAAGGRLSGIVNGIDAGWDPATDPHLAAPFAIDRWQGRRTNARHARRAFGLPDGTGPLFAVVARMVHQKGIDLIAQVAPQIAAAGGQLLAIGHGDPALERAMLALARAWPGHIGVHAGFDETLARRMFAGSDFLLMPSRFEPCGLSQLYAQRFGSLPVAHATGGLIDTIDDGVTGFLFHEPSAEALRRAVHRAFQVHRRPQLLNAMRRAAMLKRAGWDTAALEYHALYERAAASVPA